MDDAFQYHSDIYAWSRSQAAALRKLASRRDLPNELDLEHIVEEIEDVGGSQRAAVESFVRLIFVHLMKAACARSEEPKLHWRSEIIAFHNELMSRFTDAMAQDIDLQRIWDRAFKQAQAALADHGEEISPLLRGGCPFELGELVAEDLALDALFTRIQSLISQ
jgi:Domain of unknown function DUF29